MQTAPIADVSSYRHGRVPRAVRHEQIVALARELFAERGYHAASMAELARRAGITKPVIYDLAGSKEELFRSCCEASADEMAITIAEAVRTEDEAAARLRAGAVAAFRFAAKHRRAAAVLFPEAGGGFADEAVTMRRRHAELVSTLLAEEAVLQGGRPDRRQVDAAAHALVSAFEGLALWWLGHPDVSAETLADWLVALTQPGLQAMLSAGA